MFRRRSGRTARAGTMAVTATITGLALTGVVANAAPALAATSPSGGTAAATQMTNDSARSGKAGPAVNPTANAGASAHTASSADNSPAKLADQLTASAKAKATGKPVAVDALTTETLAVVANPDGTMTMTSTVHPVRVRKNGSWVPITTALTRNADGTYSPTASALPMTLSGGGTAPLVTITDPGSPSSAPRTVSLSWPAPLPKPVVSGNAALYPQVFPGVDLRMAAAGDSYTEVLIVHDAAAAANPALGTLHLTATADGLTMKQATDGRLDVVDQHGSTVFTGARPAMWDSTVDAHTGPAPSADNPGSGILKSLGTTITKAAPRDAATGADDIALTPPSGALSGVGEKFPLYIDPGLTWQQNLWVTVDSLGSTWVNSSDSNNVEVGYCGFTSGSDPCHAVADFRSYFQMNTTPLDGSTSNGTHATVSGATFNITQIWNGANGCTPTPVDLYSAAPISSSTSYPGPEASFLSEAKSGAGNGCSPANVSLNAQAFMQSTANNWWSNATVELRAPNTSDDTEWKQFNDNPVLSVTYFYPPNAATNLYVDSGVSCNGTTYVNTLTPTLTAKATDNNSPPLNVNLRFSINRHSGTASNTPSGNVGSWQVPAGALTADTSYTYSVSVDNGHLPAPSTTTSGAFTVLAPPPTTPTITSFDYPPDYWGQPSGTGGAFTASSPDPNLQGFIYTLTGPGTERAADSATCTTKRVQNVNSSGQLTDGFAPIRDGSAAIAIPPGLSVGYHTLNVQAVNYANMPSHESATYAFYVAPDITHPSANLALHRPVTVSSTVNSNWPASNLTDGNYQATGTDNGWSSVSHTAAANTEWASVDLGSAQTVDDVELYPRDESPTTTGDCFPAAFTIATSTDGTTWTTQYSAPGSYPEPGDSAQRFVFAPTTARYVKATATSLTTDTYGTYYFQLKQIAAYNGVTSTRYPAVGGNVSASVTGTNGDNPYILTQVGVYSGLSDGAQTFFVGSQVGDIYTLKFSVPTAGYYALGADMTRAANYGQVSYAVDGKALTANGASSFNGYRSNCCDTTYVVLGGAYLSSGQHALAMTVTGSGTTSAAAYNAGVDYLSVAPVSSASFADFSSAMNNNGITADNQQSTASFDLANGNNALSASALSAAGLTTASTVPINGYAFRLTAPNSGGYDNVVALGQTIQNPVPGTPTKSVALLAAATCGTVSGGYVTITYTDGTDRQDALGTVPDWSSLTSGINPAVTMTTYDKGGTATPTTRNTYLYTVALPTDATKTIASITLPSFTTTMIQGSCSDALHVLAIGTRPADTTTVNGAAANWVGAWAAPADTTAGSSSNPAFSAKTLREVVRPTDLGTGTGAEIRVRLTNPQGASAVTFSAVTLAAQAAGTGPATLNAAAPIPLKFNGSSSVTLLPGTELYSDPAAVPSTSGGSGDLLVSLSIPGTAAVAPVHSGATTGGNGPATYVGSGDATGDKAGASTTWSSSGTATEWLYVEDADVTTSDTTQGTVAVLGDQTSLGTGADGRTWVDDLPGALASASGVVNRTPGGIVNLSTAGATASSALTNLVGTVQDEPNVHTVIIDLGTNDLLAGTGYPTLQNQLTQLISTLQGLGVTVYLTSIAPDTTTPFTGNQEQNRIALNNLITNPSNWGYAGYVDFDTVATGCGRQNSGSPGTTLPSLLTAGAPNATYYQDLANAATVPVTPAGTGSL